MIVVTPQVVNPLALANAASANNSFFSPPVGLVDSKIQTSKQHEPLEKINQAKKTGSDANSLIRRIASERDKAAFEALFKQFAPRIKALILRLGTDAATAEEIAQEAMLSVWRKAHTFDQSKASASTWLFTIARNLRIDRFRAETRPQLDPNDPALVPEPELPADENLDLKDRRQFIRKCLNELPKDQREVTELSFMEGLTHQEISDGLGIPLGTVKSRLRLAVEKLKPMIRGL